MRPTTVRLPWDVEWAVVRSTPSTLCLRTPGGDLWISQARWERLPCGDDDAGLLGAVLEFLQAAGSAQDSAQVPVSRVGPGSSRLNCRLDFAVNRITAAGVPDGVVRRRSAIVANSLVIEVDGQLLVPQWCLARSLRNPSERVVFARWAGMAAVREQLQAAFDGYADTQVPRR